MNFQPVVFSPPNLAKEKWGVPGKNGSYSGLFAEAVSGKTAFLLGDLYYTAEHLKLFDLSVPYNTECLTFLTPESLNDNSWKILIMPFKYGERLRQSKRRLEFRIEKRFVHSFRVYMWVCVLLTLLLGGLIFYRFAKCYKETISLYKAKITAEWPGSLKTRGSGRDRNIGVGNLYIFAEIQNSILYSYGMLLSVSLPRLPDAWALRVFIGWWWLYSILVAVAYRASMTAILANPISRYIRVFKKNQTLENY